jgi:alpha-tubulin suppressor-like RCC1 family protein
MFIAKDGTSYVFGSNSDGQLGLPAGNTYPRRIFTLPQGIAGFSDIAVGSDFSAAISNGVLYTWGANDFGQLGDGPTESRSEPKRVVIIKPES